VWGIRNKIVVLRKTIILSRFSVALLKTRQRCDVPAVAGLHEAGIPGPLAPATDRQGFLRCPEPGGEELLAASGRGLWPQPDPKSEA